MTLRAALGGILAGLLAAAASFLVAELTGESTIASIPLLAVALAGLALGAAAALWTYLIAATASIALTIVMPDRLASAADLARLTTFLVGAPLVVLAALGVERGRRRSSMVRDQSAAAERLAVSERAAADSARRELQAALQLVERERTRLEEVAEAIPEPLIVYDADGRGTYANRAALRSFGRSFYDRPVEEWARLAAPRDDRGRPLAAADWPQVRARTDVYRRRLLVRLPMSGRDVLIDVEGTPVPDGGCVLLLRDVGKEVDERRRLSRFGSFVAHELRNPLAVAKARIELASRERDPSSRAADHGARALESVDAAIRILDRLELFSRAEAGRLEATIAEFSLHEAATAAIERLRVSGSEREVDVTVSGDARLTGDRQLTEQALTNLLTNADRYSDEGTIHVEIVGGRVPEVRVRDGGPGIPEDVADLLFRDRVSSGRGLGLGLYLVRAAMEAQGGTASLEERHPGAVFALRWPRRPAGDGGSLATAPPALGVGE